LFIFIRIGESITCVVDGPRQYSADLPQDRLELPCKLLFSSPSPVEFNKMRKLVISAMEKSHLEPSTELSESQLTMIVMNSITTTCTESSVMKCSGTTTQGDDHVAVDDIECSPPKKIFDEEGIIMGNELTDIEINFVQQLF